jgi:hypothetical protein
VPIGILVDMSSSICIFAFSVASRTILAYIGRVAGGFTKIFWHSRGCIRKVCSGYIELSNEPPIVDKAHTFSVCFTGFESCPLFILNFR